MVGMLTTRIVPSAGRMCVGSVDVVAEPARARQLFGVVSQGNTLDRCLPARDNLTLHDRYFGMSARNARKAADQWLETFQLAHRATAMVEKLSCQVTLHPADAPPAPLQHPEADPDHADDREGERETAEHRIRAREGHVRHACHRPSPTCRTPLRKAQRQRDHAEQPRAGRGLNTTPSANSHRARGHLAARISRVELRNLGVGAVARIGPDPAPTDRGGLPG